LFTSAKTKTDEEKFVIPLKSGNWQLERRREDVRKGSGSKKNRDTEIRDEATDAAVREILAGEMNRCISKFHFES